MGDLPSPGTRQALLLHDDDLGGDGFAATHAPLFLLSTTARRSTLAVNPLVGAFVEAALTDTARQRGQPDAPRFTDATLEPLADHLATLRSAGLDRAAAEGGGERARQRLHALAAAFERMAWEADFRFLYHPKRHLLHIGYRLDEQQLDSSFYDLLASESRLTSLLAIAKGDLPVRHWSALGRPFFASGAQAGLRSWSGSMFEYLMPGLVLAEPAGSALFEACASALRAQVEAERDKLVAAREEAALAAERGLLSIPAITLRSSSTPSPGPSGIVTHPSRC